MKKLVGAILGVGAIGIAQAGLAYADNIGPGVGSECYHFEFNHVTTGWSQWSTPVPVRCVSVPDAGYQWLPAQ